MPPLKFWKGLKMGVSTDKQSYARSQRWSEEMYIKIMGYAQQHAPMTFTQAVRVLVGRGLHASEWENVKHRYLHASQDEEI